MKTISTIIGQELAKEQLKGLFSNTVLGGPIAAPIRPRLLDGPSGTGKTHLINALCTDMQEHDVYTVRVNDCDSIALQSGASTEDVISALNASQSGPVCLVLDECQKVFKGSRVKSAMERDLCQFIFPHGDKVQEKITGMVCGSEVTANFHNLILVCATNEKSALETSASRMRGEAPFARRFSLVELTNYTQEEMEEIIPSYFASIGFRIGDEAAGLVRRLHRGNMSALVAVAERLKERVTDKATLNKKEVIEACRLTEYFPRGLKRPEVRLLDALSRHTLGKALAASASGLHGKLLDSSIQFLQDQFTENSQGERISSPLITIVGSSRLQLTEFGNRYLASVKKEGFKF